MRYSFLFFLFGLSLFKAQYQNKIFFKKQSEVIYFFQKGATRDTISVNEGNVYYLLVPDSIKPFLSIQVENAQLLKGANDSLVELKYIKGMNYESIFVEEENSESSKLKGNSYVFKTLVNGTNGLKYNMVQIIFIDKREKNILIKNVFYFKSK